jgi:bifunctional UDP-N-acetylglucosamine pyrophosphorylase/glucosamine-1-phosphate N-acetyltransferase
MLTGETLGALLEEHRTQQAVVTVLTAEVSDPTGYGRILRDGDGMVSGIIEHRDADEIQRQITEINSGIYVFDAASLAAALAELAPTNDQGELYLSDVPAVVRRAGKPVAALLIDDPWQTEGVNDRMQLSRMNAEVNRRILHRWMREGVTVVDPATTWVHASVDLAADVILLPGTSLEGATSVGAGARIGPDTTLIDVEVGENAVVTRTHGSLSVIGPAANVGPYAHLRPGTVLGEGGKIGTFVETKNARMEAGAKAAHLAYLGAGVIFANYDGVRKSTTKVGAYAFVGSNSVLVAPIEVADGVYVAAGSTITDDVAPGDLAVSRSRQRNVPGWVARKRAGTKTARAAEAALEQKEPS